MRRRVSTNFAIGSWKEASAVCYACTGASRSSARTPYLDYDDNSTDHPDKVARRVRPKVGEEWYVLFRRQLAGDWANKEHRTA